MENAEERNIELLEENARLKEAMADMEIELTRTEGVLKDQINFEKNAVSIFQVVGLQVAAISLKKAVTICLGRNAESRVRRVKSRE